MNVLVINCGSSSLKYQLINSDTEEVLAKGLCERIGIEGSAITHQRAGGSKEKTEVDMSDHTQAVKYVIEKTQATLQLISELNKGRKSGEKEGWVSSGELRGHFQRKADEK